MTSGSCTARLRRRPTVCKPGTIPVWQHLYVRGFPWPPSLFAHLMAVCSEETLATKLHVSSASSRRLHGMKRPHGGVRLPLRTNFNQRHVQIHEALTEEMTPMARYDSHTLTRPLWRFQTA